jgi:hypothetical protein
VREPAFYPYTAPEPEGLTNHLLRPEVASWTPEGGMALLMYEDVRTSESPRETLLAFVQGAYEAGTESAGWEVENFRTAAAG